MLIFFIAAIAGAFILSKTVLGRYTFAIGSNEEATRLSGVNVDRWKILVYTVSGIYAGIAGGEGQVAVIAHDQTSRTGIDRVDGFVNRIEEEYPDIEVVDVQYGGGDHLRSTDLARSIILAHPDLDGFFGANEGSAIGVLNHNSGFIPRRLATGLLSKICSVG